MRKLYRKLFCLEEWNVGTIALPAGGARELIGRDNLGPIHWRASTREQSWLADPFIWAHSDSPRVLVEQFDYWSGRGRIKSVPLEGLLLPGGTREEITLPFHTSYPCVFRSNESWYCIPESSESRAVNLYVWNPVTERWQLDCCLLEGIRVRDPTALLDAGVWYLFGTLSDDGPRSKLRIWFSHSLKGPWQAHALNPARSAPDQVRPAGPIFRLDGCLYRPSQDCRRGYGSGIILNRIDSLSPLTYRETAVREWRPPQGSSYGEGLHTISLTATSAIVDGKRIRFTPLASFWKCWWRITGAVREARATRRARSRSSLEGWKL